MPLRRKVDVSEYTVFYPQALLKRPIVLCHISDIHSRVGGDCCAEAAAAIAARAFDVLVCSGDAVDCRSDKKGDLFFSLIDRVTQPIIVSAGNHEKRVEGGEGVLCFAERCRARGIQYLDNRSTVLTFGTQALRFYGYIQPFVFFGKQGALHARLRQDMTVADVQTALGTCAADMPAVLLAHDPALFDAYAAWGAPLTLSGHIHGGLIRLPFMGGLLSPARTFFPRYDAGLFTNGNARMIVSRGLTVSKFPPRLFNSPEVAFITLCPAPQA